MGMSQEDKKYPSKLILRLAYDFLWWLRQWKSAHNSGDLGLDPWVRKIPWRRERLPTPVFLPGEFHGQRGLVGNSPGGWKESDTTKQLTLFFHCLSDTALWKWMKGVWIGNWGSVRWPQQGFRCETECLKMIPERVKKRKERVSLGSSG